MIEWILPSAGERRPRRPNGFLRKQAAFHESASLSGRKRRNRNAEDQDREKYLR